MFYESEIFTRASSDCCIMVLPLYGERLTKMSSKCRLRRSLVHDIVTLHCDFIVHHDINPTNIVRKDTYNWKIIDFGMTECHNPSNKLMYLPFNIGTENFVPNYEKNSSRGVFWLFMKDWYGFSKTLNYVGLKCNLFKSIEQMNKEEIIRKIKRLLRRYNEKCPYYCETNQTNQLDNGTYPFFAS
jgi:serine/threonine protein kinase